MRWKVFGTFKAEGPGPAPSHRNATRAQFEAMCGPRGAFLIVAPEDHRSKFINAKAGLGGVSWITFQMSSAMLDMKRSSDRSIARLPRDRRQGTIA